MSQLAKRLQLDQKKKGWERCLKNKKCENERTGVLQSEKRRKKLHKKAQKTKIVSRKMRVATPQLDKNLGIRRDSLDVRLRRLPVACSITLIQRGRARKFCPDFLKLLYGTEAFVHISRTIALHFFLVDDNLVFATTKKTRMCARFFPLSVLVHICPQEQKMLRG